MQGQDLTKGNIPSQLWSLAWPMMLSMFFYTLYNIVDAFWVGKLSPEAIAAVSVSQISLFIMVSLSMGITIGSGVLIAMNIGAKNKKEAERVLGQSFALSAIAALFFTTISLVFKNELLTYSGAAGAIFPLALDYFTWTAGGSILLFILMTIVFAFNSQGDTFTPTKLFAISTVINLILDPVLIFGWYGAPQMGISGAALATLVSQGVFIFLAIRSLQSEKRMIRFKFSNLTFVWESVKKVLSIGVPASLTQVINPVGLAALMYITSVKFLEAGTVAFSLGFRVEFFAFLPAVGFGFGAMAMIGQNIGAGKLERARDVFRTALKYGIGAATGLGLLAILFASPLTSVFTTDPQVVGFTHSYIWIVALSYGFLAATMIEATTFQAIGRSWPGFWIFFLRLAVVSIPLSYLTTQALNMPIQGIWASLVAGNIVAATVGYIWITKSLNKAVLKGAPVKHH